MSLYVSGDKSQTYDEKFSDDKYEELKKFIDEHRFRELFWSR